MRHTSPKPSPEFAPPFVFSNVLRWLLLAITCAFFILHFLHLNADFPNNSPWVDWSKYTDEGWYGDAAIRHVLFGHWYWKGDFNPAVALPVWPAFELIVFRIFGVSAAAARALTLCVFGVTLFTAWTLLERYTRPRTATSSRPLAAPLAVLFLSVSPFLYVFERMAILEPLLICLTLLALQAASHLHPLRELSSRPNPEPVEGGVERHLLDLPSSEPTQTLSSRPKAAHFAAAAERPAFTQATISPPTDLSRPDPEPVEGEVERPLYLSSSESTKTLSSRPERSAVERPAFTQATIFPLTELSSRPESSQPHREDAVERPPYLSSSEAATHKPSPEPRQMQVSPLRRQSAPPPVEMTDFGWFGMRDLGATTPNPPSQPAIPPSQPDTPAPSRKLPGIALGLLLPAIILTKTTGIALFPAIAYMVWARAGYRLRTAVRFAILPSLMTAGIWLAYFFLFVHPHYLADYQYLFSANGYTGIELDPFASVILKTVSDGMWMGRVLYPLFFIIIALGLFWRPRLFRNPLVPSLLLWIAGYFAFLGYHNNLQPRYYIVVAVPITLLVALGLDCFREARGPKSNLIAATMAAVAVLAIAIPDAIQTLNYVRHPEYTFRTAAEAIRKIVLADKPHPNLVLSISGSDITLMTGLPSIDDDFGTMELADRARTYRPGWYAAWNELDDDKMDALTPLFHVQRVAAFPAMDDPDRNLLILYRLDPTDVAPPPAHKKRRTPKPLVTKLGQQPTTQQLTH